MKNKKYVRGHGYISLSEYNKLQLGGSSKTNMKTVKEVQEKKMEKKIKKDNRTILREINNSIMKGGRIKIIT